jgi:hypothetical protein
VQSRVFDTYWLIKSIPLGCLGYHGDVWIVVWIKDGRHLSVSVSHGCEVSPQWRTELHAPPPSCPLPLHAPPPSSVITIAFPVSPAMSWMFAPSKLLIHGTKFQNVCTFWNLNEWMNSWLALPLFKNGLWWVCGFPAHRGRCYIKSTYIRKAMRNWFYVSGPLVCVRYQDNTKLIFNTDYFYCLRIVCLFKVCVDNFQNLETSISYAWVRAQDLKHRINYARPNTHLCNLVD